MNKAEFENFIKNRIVFLDGATGSNLIKRGMPSGICPEKWIIENPEAICDLQRDYSKAGSDIILAPTFTANRIKLAEYGLEGEVSRINHELVALSKSVARDGVLVAADISMTGVSLSPIGDMPFEELVDVYKEQIECLVDAGIDLICIETMMSLQETRAALLAAKEVCELPVMCTMTFAEDGRTIYGTDAKTAAITLESLGAVAVGVNCSTGPDKLLPIIEDMHSVVSIPIIAKPNAGLPLLDKDGNTYYSMKEEEFSAGVKKLVMAGASIIGGCCGTSPTYIKAIKAAMSGMLPKASKAFEGRRILSSERKTLEFGLEDPFLVVGERINPTGKKALQAELKEGSLSLVLQYTEEQEQKGASLLDINVGMGEIDEKETMLKVLNEVTVHTSLPLSIDTSSCEVLEAALRIYPGRALVNSISAETEVMDRKLDIAKKYGAMIIILPLSDAGLPKDFEEKKRNLNTVLDAAFKRGFKKEDIVVDGLVSTIGACPTAAVEVLETIKYCKEEGYATTCGLSNISFGLPQRAFVNSAFLTMAVMQGLTMAILNPSQDLLLNSAFSSDLLLNKQGAALRYIDRMNSNDYSLTSTGSSAATKTDSKVIKDILFEDVLKGNKGIIEAHTKEELRSRAAEEILNNSLLPAIDEVGQYFNEGKYFLPQLIASAEAMKEAIAIIEPLLLKEEGSSDMPVIVMATVKGDIHDIGKNLVVMMLKNHGFKVIDLGKDVPKEEIIEATVQNNAAIIGLSALMTTTMEQMREVIQYAHEMKVDARIMVGGAVITEDYARQIGADGYSKDAAEAVVVAKKMLAK